MQEQGQKTKELTEEQTFEQLKEVSYALCLCPQFQPLPLRSPYSADCAFYSRTSYDPDSGCSRDMLSHSTCTVRVSRADREIFARSRVRRQYGVLEHRGRGPRARREPRRPAHAGRRHGHLCAIAAFGAQAEDHDVRDAAEERCQRISVVRMNTRVAHLSTCALLRTLILTLKNIISPVFYSIISTI